jgi:protein-tyrosine phosphatase
MTDTIPAKVCFVCTGNTCRSPMAEAVYNHFAKKSGVKSYAVSAGLDPREHDSINARAAAALESRGIEVPDHFAVEISDDIMRGCDKIIGITEGHMMRLILLFPYAAMKISAFPENVSDPWGGDLSVYEECLDTIIKNIKEMFGFYD